jgi:hypothetical protein
MCVIEKASFVRIVRAHVAVVVLYQLDTYPEVTSPITLF